MWYIMDCDVKYISHYIHHVPESPKATVLSDTKKRCSQFARCQQFTRTSDPQVFMQYSEKQNCLTEKGKTVTYEMLSSKVWEQDPQGQNWSGKLQEWGGTWATLWMMAGSGWALRKLWWHKRRKQRMKWVVWGIFKNHLEKKWLSSWTR